MKKKLVMLGLTVVLAAGLSACGKSSDAGSNMNHSGTDHSGMEHAAGEPLPTGLKNAANPKFKVGTQAVIQDDHMPGMKGATGTIVGAYDTTVYAVSYVPVTGGAKVTDHKWVVHEEIKDAGSKPFSKGEEVTLNAEHMKGMKGAKATIDSAVPMTVYAVDYTPTTGGDPVKNHMWVTEDELSAK